MVDITRVCDESTRDGDSDPDKGCGGVRKLTKDGREVHWQLLAASSG
jgi:hypothetical protein